MPINKETLNKRLEKALGRFRAKPVDTSGEVIPLADDADAFKFNFTKDGEDYGTVYATIDDTNTLTLWFDDAIMDSPSAPTPGVDYNDTWFGFLEYMKKWALNNQLRFNKDNKDHLGTEMARRKSMKQKEQIAEGYHAMGKKASYNDAVPNVKIVLQHSKVMQEGEQRFRHIEKIFVENANGERFLVPTTKPGLARVFARHIAEGGTPYDERANHIQSLVEEYNKMAGFVRATRSGQFNESAQQLVQEGVNHYVKLRESLSKMTGHRGYTAYFENWTPSLMEDESDAGTINELFVQETLDPRIESVMPILSRLHKQVAEMKEVSELDEWAESLLAEKMVMGADTDASSGGTVNAYIEEDEGIQSNNPQGIPEGEVEEGKTGPGLWANIHAKQNRIKHGSGEKMRKPGSKGAPTAQNFKDAANESAELAKQHGWTYNQGEYGASMTHPKHGRISLSSPITSRNGDTAVEREWTHNYSSGVGDRSLAHHLQSLKEQEVSEDLDANQKRVGQLGPTEKVGPKGAVGKLVGANESVQTTMKLLDMLSENFINTSVQAVTAESADYGDLENEYYYVIDTQSGEVVDGPFDSVGEVPLRLMGFDGGHKVVKGAELKGHDEVTEGRADSPVSQAITRRILNQRQDLLKYGPDNVMAAIDTVADWVDLGPDDEIGSSDVSGWVDQVARYLRTQAGEGLQFTEDESFNKMMNKMTSKSALDTREATAMMFDLIHDQGASYEEALHQASVSYEIDPAELKAAYQQSQGTDKEGVAEGKSEQWKVRSLSPDDESWGISRSVKNADGKYQSETHSKKFSSREAAAAAAKKLNSSIKEQRVTEGQEDLDAILRIIKK